MFNIGDGMICEECGETVPDDEECSLCGAVAWDFIEPWIGLWG